MSEEPLPQEDTIEDDAQNTFDAQGRYWLLGGAAVLAGVSLLFELREGFTWPVVLFSLIGLLGGGWALWMATTSVIVTDAGILLKRLVGSRNVAWQQMISVTAQGRFLSVLTVLYHPRRGDGIVDTDAVRSLLIPSVKNQGDLLALLETKVER